MHNSPLKPRIQITPKPRPAIQRLPKRIPLQMTLINGFRARNGGILLCADRQEDDGYSKTEIDKIYSITTDFKAFQLFIAGSGPSEIISKAKEHIHRSLLLADRGNDILGEHQTRIEGSLRYIYKEYSSVLNRQSMGLIIVVAPRSPNTVPRMYSTVEYRLYYQNLYCAHGTGKPISDYLADRLYKEGMDRNTLALLGAFILRETERKASGVGMGFDMVLIDDGKKGCHHLGWNTIKKIQSDIPLLSDTVFP